MIKVPSLIKSKNLIFKPVSILDFDDFYKSFCNSFDEITPYYIPWWARFENVPSAEEMKEFVSENEQNFKNKDGFLFSVYSRENDFIGQAELHHIDYSVPKARLGYWVSTNKAGNGYATEMASVLTDFGFNILNCERLEIRNHVRNKASGKIAQKLGYKFLAIFEKNKMGKKGDLWDLEIHAKLKSENPEKIDIEYIYDQS